MDDQIGKTTDNQVRSSDNGKSARTKQPMSQTVVLYRYDLTNGMARQFSQQMLGRFVEAIWHTSIVVYGWEFYFDGGVGIACEEPGSTRFGAPFRTEPLGVTTRSLEQFADFNAAQQGAFGPECYDLLRRNCNHYSDAAAQFLLGRGIPADVAGMVGELLATPLGAMMRPSLEQMTRNPNVHAGLPPPPHAPPPQGHRSAGQQAAPAAAGDDIPVGAEARDRLNAACEALESEGDIEAASAAARTLTTIVEHLLRQPAEAKYRRVSRKAATYVASIGQVPAAEGVLRAAGFVLVDSSSAAAAEGEAGASSLEALVAASHWEIPAARVHPAELGLLHQRLLAVQEALLVTLACAASLMD